MMYYRLKEEFDNYKASRSYNIFVGRELYTPAEARKILQQWAVRNTRRGQKVPITPAMEQAFYAMFTLVEIPRSHTYWCFGARFADYTKKKGDTSNA